VLSLRHACALAAAALLAGCVTLTEQPRAIVAYAGSVAVEHLPCGAASAALAATSNEGAIEASAIRLLTWNIHKQADDGWQRDLGRFVDGADIVLLQEAVLSRELRGLLEGAGFGWVMASSFLYGGHDIGVLTASRVAPAASCTERIGEPLIVVPKSGVVTWFRLQGGDAPLAVVNLHAINFALTLGAFDRQLTELAAALAGHRGPVIFAGDFNTWTDERRAAVQATAAKLGLREAALSDDRRSRFFGRQVDHVLVRGLDVVDAYAVAVHSSDHNPVIATLRISR
jgi:endonuclease/exonuclease/phosphatase (EEP) superfamily protein YafD